MKRRAGFTLIELLVVVAIIALLIAILLPSLSKAKANATRVKCAAQLKQWGTVITMYAQENQDWFGIYWQEANAGAKHFWNGIAVGTPELYDPEWGSIDSNTGMSKYSVAMRTCPGDPAYGQYAAAGAQGGAVAKAGSRPPVDYAMVRYLPIVSGITMWKTVQATHPGTTMLMCDSPTIQYGVGSSTMKGYYACTTVGVPTTGDLDSEPGQTLSQALDQRHFGIGNAMFLDAHVEQVKYQDYVANMPSTTVAGSGGYIATPVEASKVWTSLTTP